MVDVKISDMSPAASATDTQEFEVNDGGTTRKVTGAQIKAYAQNGISSFSVGDVLQSSTVLSSPWLLCDGRKVSQSGNSALFAVTGHQNSPLRYPITPGFVSVTLDTNGFVSSDLKWSPDGRYLAAAAGNNNCCIFDWSNSPPTRSWVLAISGSTAVTWSPDGKYLASRLFDSPYFAIYDFSTGSPVDVTGSPTALETQPVKLAWSPNGRYLAMTMASSPYVAIYDCSTGAPIRLSNPATLPTGVSRGLGWSPDSRYLAVPHSNSPYFTVYDLDSNLPVKLSNPASLPAGNGYWCVWNPKGNILSVGHDNSPYISNYSFATGALVKMADPAPAGNPAAAVWGFDGKYQYVTSGTSPYIFVYDWTNGVPIKITTPLTFSASLSAIAISPDGKTLVIQRSSTPALLVASTVERPASDFYLPKISQVGSLKSYIKAA